MEEQRSKTTNFQDGLGAVTEQMIRERARELALIKGRDRPNSEDREQARRELLEMRARRDELDPAEEGLETLDPSQNRVESGHQTPDNPTDDEETMDRKLAERGVREADHEQMVAGYESNLEEESEAEKREEMGERVSADEEDLREERGSK